jgi:hypothetical protein
VKAEELSFLGTGWKSAGILESNPHPDQQVIRSQLAGVNDLAMKISHSCPEHPQALRLTATKRESKY